MLQRPFYFAIGIARVEEPECFHIPNVSLCPCVLRDESHDAHRESVALATVEHKASMLAARAEPAIARMQLRQAKRGSHAEGVNPGPAAARWSSEARQQTPKASKRVQLVARML